MESIRVTMNGYTEDWEKCGMKFFVTGVCGQLGHDVMMELKRRGYESVGSDIIENLEDGEGYGGQLSYVQLDITDSEAVECVLLEAKPDVVIHCAAWTAVDLAEEQNRRELVWAINVDGTQIIADSCRKLNCKMIYISTDYVFDGRGTKPWKPDDSAIEPLNFYGRTKLQGEQAVFNTLEKFFIVRIAWAFGRNGSNFVRTMLDIGRKCNRVRVVNDQIGTPTYTPDLARLLVDMGETEKYGVYHATNEGGYISWYDFCCNIYEQAGLHVEVIPVTTAEYGLSKAMRPANSRLDREKLVEKGFVLLPDWRDAVARYLRDTE